MKYIEEITHDEEIPINVEHDLNKDGETVKNVKEMVFGKIVTVEGKTEKKYFVLTYDNQIYDPLGASSTREDFIETKLKMVSKDTFDYYSIYLKTKNSIYLTKANRRFLNE